jgi:hypothetical protein
MRRAALVLLALLALAAPLSACGGGDDAGGGETGSTAPPSVGGTAADGGAEEGRTRAGATGKAPSGDGSAANEGGGGGEAGSPGRVDLTVDPGSIRGARVTATGAVQTLPPDEESHQVAQENGYSSINSFGEEAAGEEATEITFALVQYLTARVEGDWPTACARLYGFVRENLESSTGRPCPDAYGDLMSRVPQASLEEQASIDVSSVRRGESDRAFVIYKTPGTLSVDMPMYVEDGVWKVAALEAYALTPDQVG